MGHGGLFGVSDRAMLALKILNFSFSLGKGALVPFLTVYFRLVGINAFQSGLLGAARWMVTPWSLSLWKFLLDRCDHRKTVLFVSVVLGIVFNFSLVFVGNVKESDGSTYRCEAAMNVSTTEQGNKLLVLGSSTTLADKIKNMDKVMQGNNRSVANATDKYENLSLKTLQRRSIETKSSPGGIVNSRFVSNGSILTHKANVSTGTLWKYPKGTFDFSRTFLGLLVLVISSSLVSPACSGLISTITNNLVQQNMGNYGVYQVFCTLGTVLSAMLVGLLVDILKCRMFFSNSFWMHFCLYAAFTVVAALAILPIDFPPSKSLRNASIHRILKFIVTSMHTLVFVTTLFFIGTVESVVYNFLFWYMMDIGTTVTNMGLVVALGALPEVLVTLKSGQLTNLIGNSWILFFMLLLNTLRLLYFSYVRNPWLIPLTEVIYGFMRPLMWTACKSYAVHISPYGTEDTFQTIFTGLYYGIGMGLGGISMGFLYQLYGPVVVFRCTAGLCGVFCLLLAVLFCILELPDRNEIDMLDYQQVVQQDSKDKDWLLEALSVDDEVTHFSR